MGDYLSDLVTKNIGTANVIQPRRSARFEPLQAKGALEAQIEPPSLQTESFEEEHIIETMPPSSRRKREVKLRERDEIISSREDSDEQIAQALLIPPPKAHSSENGQNDARVTLAPKLIEAVREPTTQNLSVPNPSSLTLSALVTPTQPSLKSAESRKKLNSIIEHAPIQTHRESLSATGELKAPPEKISGKQGIEAHAQIIVEPRVEKIENRVEEATIYQTVIPMPREQMSKQISERAEVPETPTINVTIGRVEVRAVTSSAPSKETTYAKPQTLSLDEYLRKRHNGGER